MLTHTSGVDGDFFDDFGRGDDAVARYVAACADLPQVFSPGAMWSYCNAAFSVLGRIIEVMTDLTWDAALKTRLLEPLGVTHTVTFPEDALLHNTAAGHRVTPSLEMPLVERWGMPRGAGPAGATPCSTVGDLLSFARLHIDGGVTRDGARLLSESSVRKMQQPEITLPPTPGDGAAHWGLGWMLFDWGGRRVIGHDGGTLGQQSSLRVLPDERFAVALLTNSIGGGLLAQRVRYWFFGQILGMEMPARPAPPELAPDIDLGPYAGLYERLGFRTTISLRGGALMAQTVNTGPLATDGDQLPEAPMFAVDRSLFVQQNPWGLFDPVVFSDFDNAGRPRYMYAGRVARRIDEPAP
jgi:CubicO group peptidase (beta-lactamase class C family)